MKNRKNSFVTALLATVTLLFVGCSNGLNTPGTVKGVDPVRSVCIELTNFASSDTSARTVAPNAISKGDTANYIFIAEGKNARKTFGPVKCNTDAGKIVLENLDAGVWTITITMYDKTLLGEGVDLTDATAIATDDNKATCAVLSGNAVVDLTKANATTSMTLTPDGIGTNGKVALTLKFNQEDLNKKDSKGLEYVAGLYNKINGTLVAGTETAAEPLANETYSVGSIAKGLYTFKVTITATTDGTGPWYYSDDIYIEGNRTTSKEINLPKIIGEAPDAPLTLGFDFGEKNANLGRYTAKFSWARDSYNESGFELEIVELNSIPTTIVDDLFNSTNTLFVESNIFTVENFASTKYPIYAKDGTLLAGSQEINYDLETGKVYVARIRAVNYNGKSDWVKIDNFINCYTVTYDFAGYQLVKDAEPPLTPSIVEFVEYSDVGYATQYQYTDYKLYKADVEPSADPDNSITWTGWKNRDAGEDAITSYDGFKNIVLTPKTNVKNFVDFEIESAGTFETVLIDNLFAGTSANPESAATEITYADEDSKLHVAVPKQIVKDYGTYTVTYTVTEVKYTLKGIDGSNVGGKTGDASTNNFTASFDLVDIYAGDYILYAEAKLTSGYIVTTQIPLKIQ